MKGHLSYSGDGLSIYIKEPNPDLMFRSIIVYEEYYNKAYGEGIYIKDEVMDIMYEKELYTPFDDIDIEKYKKDIEELKYQAFKNFHKPKELRAIKTLLRRTEEMLTKLYKKKYMFEHLTCEAAASLAQWNWIIEKSTFYTEDDTQYDWQHLSLSYIMSFYEASAVSTADFRAVARSDTWRPIWLLGKKTGNLFDKPSTELTKDQVILCSFSNMYDGVYESPESPDEKIIEDDDCLDGWFIDQKRKHDRSKKEQESKSFTQNKKIANSSEIFIVADSPEEIAHIESFNDENTKQIKKERMQLIAEKGEIKSDLQFRDVAMDIIMDNNKAMIQKAKGR
jgi:hypothetical protein